MNELKRALALILIAAPLASAADKRIDEAYARAEQQLAKGQVCLLYTSDAADEL